jgi:hypothetical protein
MAATFAAVALYALLACAMFTRTRQWGLGVGIFLVVMILFQTVLWNLGLQRLRQSNPNFQPDLLGFAFKELINLLAAALCVALRWIYPAKPNQLPEPTLASGTSPAGQEPRLR